MPTLNWLDRETAVKAAEAVPFRVLDFDPALSAGDPSAENLIIQGDNLDAVKAVMHYYLLFNGILGDKRPLAGNVLNAVTFRHLPPHAAACRPEDRVRQGLPVGSRPPSPREYRVPEDTAWTEGAMSRRARRTILPMSAKWSTETIFVVSRKW